MAKAPRDVERIYTTGEVVAKLRRLADALESEQPFRIQVAGERIRVPARGQFSIEHERGEDEEEIEFQLKWSVSDVSGDDDGDASPRSDRATVRAEQRRSGAYVTERRRPSASICGHVVRGQREVAHLGVGDDPLLLLGLGDHHHAVLQVPADDDLRGRPAVALRDLADDRVVERAAAQGAVALEHDAALAVAVEDRAVEEQRAPLDLVDRAVSRRSPW